MWTRSDIKDYAKKFLRKHYWKAFVVCLIATLLNGGGSGGSSNNSNNNNYKNEYTNENITIDEFDDVMGIDTNSAVDFVTNNIRSPLFLITGGVLSAMVVVFIIILITVGFVVEVGKSRFFLEGFKGDVSIKKLFSAFNSKEYLPIVKTQFLRGLYNLLWTLLLIVPGIIKSYEYRFVPYILSENPTLSSKEVISRSRAITNGHKMDMFVLDLSFFGWYILGALLLGVGVFFVDPYAEATYARLYNLLSCNDDEDLLPCP